MMSIDRVELHYMHSWVAELSGSREVEFGADPGKRGDYGGMKISKITLSILVHGTACI